MSLRARAAGVAIYMNEKQYYVYILTNKTHSVLYKGMTNDLKRRVYEHKNKLHEGFTKKYNVNQLVYYEAGDEAAGAIWREKQLKDVSRAKKIKLIESMNKEWRDLYEDF
jgi:putative endonuclease